MRSNNKTEKSIRMISNIKQTDIENKKKKYKFMYERENGDFKNEN